MLEDHSHPVDLYNPINDLSLIDDAYANKVALLSKFMVTQTPSVVSLGCGGGQELVAFKKAFAGAERIIGVDMSATALRRTKELCERYQVHPELIEASVLSLPIESKSMDAVCSSHILHEIYSEEGRSGWHAALQEMFRVLAHDGYIFIRDFAAPPLKLLETKPRTQTAKDFMGYFRPTFLKAYPQSSSDHIALEMLLHFKTFMSDIKKDVTHIGDPTWHELVECYVPPLGLDDEIHTYLDQDAYVAEVVSAMKGDSGQSASVECVYSEQLSRPSTNELLNLHFEVQSSQKLASLDTIDFCTRKMQIVLKKS